GTRLPCSALRIWAAHVLWAGRSIGLGRARRKRLLRKENPRPRRRNRMQPRSDPNCSDAWLTWSEAGALLELPPARCVSVLRAYGNPSPSVTHHRLSAPQDD